MLKFAVERQFAIISEALNQSFRLDANLASQISESRKIVVRNLLIRSYARVSDEVVWSIIQTKLPRLKREVQKLLEN